MKNKELIERLSALNSEAEALIVLAGGLGNVMEANCLLCTDDLLEEAPILTLHIVLSVA